MGVDHIPIDKTMVLDMVKFIFYERPFSIDKPGANFLGIPVKIVDDIG